MLAALISWVGHGLWAAGDYGLPSTIQEGNILHCFDWTINDVKQELPDIAAAGFGSIQLSPLQRGDVRTGSAWHDLYRPYDLAFKEGLGTRQELTDLCAEAEKYGIKIIVDVVANHVDKTAGYHDTWWDSNERIRWNGGINYGDRYSITHGQLGDYGDINSESSEVQARAKAYIEDLKSMGVKGCRWDAAKHIGLPSEGCDFWKTVTSVPGMWHYGEILDSPGPNEAIIEEYGTYMSVTDNRYSNVAARENGGLPFGYGGSWEVDHGMGAKVVYWAESHDTYSNDEWSQNVDQSIIDRAYCSFACRNGATALYLSRPNTRGFGNIKVGKGSTAFTSKHIAEVNKFRNAMVGKADYFTNNGNAISVTRKDGGAVIVMKGSGNVSIANGGGYCPAGTYTDKVSGGTFTVTATTISGNVGQSGVAVIYNGGTTTDPGTNPDPDPEDPPTTDKTHCYFVNSNGWNVKVWAWNDTENCCTNGSWPGDDMVQKGDKLYWELPAGKSVPTGIIFSNNGGEKAGGGDLVFVNGATYKPDGSYTIEDVTPDKPVVSAVPGDGTAFTETLSITLSTSPAGAIRYTLDGSNPTISSTVYSSPITISGTTTIKAFAVAEDGTKGDVRSFRYTKQSVTDPGTDPDPDPTPGKNLITDYYKVNPNGKTGSNKTINMSFNGQKSTTAMSNWTDAELIAQGVARDVAQAFKGLHERPIVDSYALYAAYDDENLYLAAQFVYTVWDLYGEGKQPGESKPYNMDGHMFWAFDLFPDKQFDGYINGSGPIWNEDAKGAKFANGVDAVWMGSTKPGVGTPGFFTPTPDGHASYDAAYCKTIPGTYYGYADGLLPSIQNIWGQPFGVTPDALKGNEGFVDLRSEIDDTAHTLYEWRFPLSLLGITADYIRNNGIGVMYCDKYGTSPVGGTPYDPSYFDNVDGEYSMDPSSSKEKEDEDVITYAPARIGKSISVSVESLPADDNGLKVYSNEGILYIISDSERNVSVTSLLGITSDYKVEAGRNVIDGLQRGFYIVDGKKIAL